MVSRLAESGAAFGAALVLFAVVAVGLYLLWRRHNTPAERERRRRLRVNRDGRIAAGEVFDIEDRSADDAGPSQRFLHYTYLIGAVSYTSSQEVSSLAEIVGEDPSGVVGAVSVKYLQKNPYNSIVVCEEWSGLRGFVEKGRSVPA